MKNQKTYKAKTAWALLQSATVQKSRAGLTEVWVDDMIAVLTDNDDMCLADSTGIIALLRLSNRGVKKLKCLEQRAKSA